MPLPIVPAPTTPTRLICINTVPARLEKTCIGGERSSLTERTGHSRGTKVCAKRDVEWQWLTRAWSGNALVGGFVRFRSRVRALNPTSEKKLRTPINIGFAVNSRIGVQQFSSIPRGIVVQTVSIPLVRIPKQLAVTEVSMRQQLRMAALAVSIVVALSTFTWAQDYDRDDYQRGGNVAQARQY